MRTLTVVTVIMILSFFVWIVSVIEALVKHLIEPISSLKVLESILKKVLCQDIALCEGFIHLIALKAIVLAMLVGFVIANRHTLQSLIPVQVIVLTARHYFFRNLQDYS